MPYEVEFHPLAAREYRLALAWYRQHSPAAAERFRTEVDRVVERLIQSPLEGIVFRGTFRWMRTRRFPYLLYYEVVDPSIVRVYSVTHGRCRLGDWLRRRS